MRSSLRCEVRRHSPILAIYVPAIIIAVAVRDLSFPSYALNSLPDMLPAITLFIASTFIGILGFGWDIASGTMGLIFSMPRSRVEIWREKVKVGAIFLVMVLSIFGTFACLIPGYRLHGSIATIAMAIYGFGIGLLLPLLIRHFAGAILLGLASSAIPYLVYIYLAPGALNFGAITIKPTFSAIAISMGALGIAGSYFAIKRLRWLETGNISLSDALRPAARRQASVSVERRVSGFLAPLVRRELHLQLVPVLLLLGFSACIIPVLPQEDGSGAISAREVALPIFLALIVLTVFLTACMSVSEPRRQDVLHLDRSQPISWRILLATKLGILSLVFMLGAVVFTWVSMYVFSRTADHFWYCLFHLLPVFAIVAAIGCVGSSHGSNLLEAIVKAGLVAAALLIQYFIIERLTESPGMMKLHMVLMFPAILVLTLLTCSQALQYPAKPLASYMRMPVILLALTAIMWLPTVGIYSRTILPTFEVTASSSRPGCSTGGTPPVLSSRASRTLLVDSSGRLWELGLGLDHIRGGTIVLPDGSSEPRMERSMPLSPTLRFPDRSWLQVVSLGYFAWAGLSSDGQIFMWGWNAPEGHRKYQFRFADGSETVIRDPIEAGMGNHWIRIAARNGLVAQKKDGTLWHFGNPNSGPTERSTWSEIGNGYRWRQVLSRGQHGVIALRDDETLWTFGVVSTSDTYGLSAGQTMGPIGNKKDSPSSRSTSLRFGLTPLPVSNPVEKVQSAGDDWIECENPDGTTTVVIRSPSAHHLVSSIPGARISETGFYIEITRDEPLGLSLILQTHYSDFCYFLMQSGEIWKVDTDQLSQHHVLIDFIADRVSKSRLPGSPNWTGMTHYMEYAQFSHHRLWILALGKDGSLWRWGGGSYTRTDTLRQALRGPWLSGLLAPSKTPKLYAEPPG